MDRKTYTIQTTVTFTFDAVSQEEAVSAHSEFIEEVRNCLPDVDGIPIGLTFRDLTDDDITVEGE